MISGLASYKWLFQALAVVGLALGVHVLIEHQRDIGRREVQARWDEQKRLDKIAALEKYAEFNRQLQEANKNASDRENTIRALAAAAGGANNGLRDTLAAIQRGVPTATIDALGKSVTTLSSVLAECSGRYQDVAEKADRHASDVKTLQEAWPKDQPAKR